MIVDHNDMTIFRRQIIDFRRWMAQRGLRDKPLIVTEYGILMPASYGFPPEVVSSFLVNTFDFFLTAGTGAGLSGRRQPAGAGVQLVQHRRQGLSHIKPVRPRYAQRLTGRRDVQGICFRVTLRTQSGRASHKAGGRSNTTPRLESMTMCWPSLKPATLSWMPNAGKPNSSAASRASASGARPMSPAGRSAGAAGSRSVWDVTMISSGSTRTSPPPALPAGRTADHLAVARPSPCAGRAGSGGPSSDWSCRLRLPDALRHYDVSFAYKSGLLRLLHRVADDGVGRRRRVARAAGKRPRRCTTRAGRTGWG